MVKAGDCQAIDAAKSFREAARYGLAEFLKRKSPYCGYLNVPKPRPDTFIFTYPGFKALYFAAKLIQFQILFADILFDSPAPETGQSPAPEFLTYYFSPSAASIFLAVR